MSEPTTQYELPHEFKYNKGQPTPEWVQAFYDTCIDNALAVCPRCDYGGLRLVTTEAEYKDKSGSATDFAVPFRPAEPNHADDASQLQVIKTKAEYELELAKYHEWKGHEKAFITAMRKSVDPEFLATLKDPKLGWHKVTPLQILTHLKTTYGKISPEQLTKNEERARTPWHPGTAPIESFW